MECDVKYPYIKIYIDTGNKAHIVKYAAEKQYSHAAITNIGSDLIDFITLDLTDIEVVYEVSEREKFFEITGLLDGKHRYVYFFLVGQLNDIFADNSISDIEKALLVHEVFIDLSNYQKRFAYAVYSCLDIDNLPKYTIAEKYYGFLTLYPEYNWFILKSALTIYPTYKGNIDFMKVETINERELNTKDMLKLIHSDYDGGVSLARYTIIESLHEMLYFEFSEMLKQGLYVKKCKLCSRYFILQTKHETDYCDRISKGKRTCKQVGAKKSYNERVAADPVLQKYQRVYKRYFARTANGGNPFEKYPDSKFYNISFSEWSKIAYELRCQYLNGEITEAELLNGIQG